MAGFINHGGPAGTMSAMQAAARPRDDDTAAADLPARVDAHDVTLASHGAQLADHAAQLAALQTAATDAGHTGQSDDGD
jgi:hypothetical protein